MKDGYIRLDLQLVNCFLDAGLDQVVGFIDRRGWRPHAGEVAPFHEGPYELDGAY